MSNTTSGLIARRYAAALLEMAIDAKALEQVERDMLDLSAMLQGSAELQSLVRNPLI